MLAIELVNAQTLDLIYLDALRRLIDATLGYPRQADNHDPLDPTSGWTWTCSEVRMHPTDRTRWAMYITDEMAGPLAAIVAGFQDKVAAGTANDNERAIAALPEPAALDQTWT